MTTAIHLSERPAIEYPESDGLPMADNTIQFRWISTIMWGLDALFVHNPNVFVAGNLLWYPVEGAPDDPHRSRRLGCLGPSQGGQAVVQAVGGSEPGAPGGF